MGINYLINNNKQNAINNTYKADKNRFKTKTETQNN